MYKLIIFDLDGTLVDRDTDEILPGVQEWFDNKPDDCIVMVATNQGGVGLRHWMETDQFGEPEKFPALSDFEARIQSLAGRFPQIEHVAACFRYQSKSSGKWGPLPQNDVSVLMWAKTWRKPYPGMLFNCMRLADVTPEETLMVGDSEEDEQAAKNAGCEFVHADAFFGRNGKTE